MCFNVGLYLTIHHAKYGKLTLPVMNKNMPGDRDLVNRSISRYIEYGPSTI